MLLLLTAAALYPLIGDVLTSYFTGRLTDLSGDGSFNARYLILTSLFDYRGIWTAIFGGGFGADFEDLGSNAASYIISVTGLFGLFFLICITINSLRARPRKILALLPVVMAAPLFTYGYFAVWLVLYLQHDYFALNKNIKNKMPK